MSTIDHEGFSLSDWVVDEALNEDGFTLDLNSLSPSLASSGKPSPSRSLSTSPRSMPVATATEPHSYGFAIPRWTASTSTSGSEMHSHNTSASSLTRLSASSWPSPSTSAGCSGLTPPPGGAMLPSGASESPASYSQWRTHPSSASAQQLERVGACSSAEPRPFVTKLLAILSENNFAIKWDRRVRLLACHHSAANGAQRGCRDEPSSFATEIQRYSMRSSACTATGISAASSVS